MREQKTFDPSGRRDNNAGCGTLQFEVWGRCQNECSEASEVHPARNLWVYLSCFGWSRARPAALPGADQRDAPGLPGRLPELLRERADGRPRSAGVVVATWLSPA